MAAYLVILQVVLALQRASFFQLACLTLMNLLARGPCSAYDGLHAVIFPNQMILNA